MAAVVRWRGGEVSELERGGGGGGGEHQHGRLLQVQAPPARVICCAWIDIRKGHHQIKSPLQKHFWQSRRLLLRDRASGRQHLSQA